jgi:hypothetical protein
MPVPLAILRDKSGAIIVVIGITVENDHTASEPAAAVLHSAARVEKGASSISEQANNE